jgi:hypothetical protein
MAVSACRTIGVRSRSSCWNSGASGSTASGGEDEESAHGLRAFGALTACFPLP